MLLTLTKSDPVEIGQEVHVTLIGVVKIGVEQYSAVIGLSGLKVGGATSLVLGLEKGASHDFSVKYDRWFGGYRCRIGVKSISTNETVNIWIDHPDNVPVSHVAPTSTDLFLLSVESQSSIASGEKPASLPRLSIVVESNMNPSNLAEFLGTLSIVFSKQNAGNDLQILEGRIPLPGSDCELSRLDVSGNNPGTFGAALPGLIEVIESAIDDLQFAEQASNSAKPAVRANINCSFKSDFYICNLNSPILQDEKFLAQVVNCFVSNNSTVLQCNSTIQNFAASPIKMVKQAFEKLGIKSPQIAIDADGVLTLLLINRPPNTCVEVDGTTPTFVY